MKNFVNNKRVLLASTLFIVTAPIAVQAEEWEFAISPLFLWGISIDGDATIDGNTAPLDIDFKDDVLENMEGVFTLHFEGRRGDWGFFTEYQFADLEPDITAELGPFGVNASVSFKENVFEAGGTWAFVNNDATRWELLAGARYTDQDVKVDVRLGGDGPLPIEPELRIKGGDDWWHGIFGVRLVQRLSDSWTFVGRADYGYGGSDNTAANLAFQFDYQFNDWGSVFIGGRYLDYDYDDRSYGFDAAKAGPLAGLTIRW
jgi:hypothetical protein